MPNYNGELLKKANEIRDEILPALKAECNEDEMDLDFFGFDKTAAAIDCIQMHCPPEGHLLAFSGGKDSIVVRYGGRERCSRKTPRLESGLK